MGVVVDSMGALGRLFGVSVWRGKFWKVAFRILKRCGEVSVSLLVLPVRPWYAHGIEEACAHIDWRICKQHWRVCVCVWVSWTRLPIISVSADVC